MLYAVENICKDIRKALEFNNESESLLQFGDIDTLSMDEIVLSTIEPSARYIIQNAALPLCGTGTPLEEEIQWKDDQGKGTGYMILPDNFMRLLTFQMLEWETAPDVITEDDPKYALQSSKHAGLRGNPEAPVVAVCHYPEGMTLELYSCEAGEEAYIKKASYLPYPKIKEDHLEMPERLYDAVVRYAAHMVATAYSSVSVANSLLAEAKVMAGIAEPEAAAVEQQ